MLTGLIRLRSLDLSSNKLTLIDGALETLITLEQLNLRSNALVAIAPDSFKVRIFPIQFIYFIVGLSVWSATLVCFATRTRQCRQHRVTRRKESMKKEQKEKSDSVNRKRTFPYKSSRVHFFSFYSTDHLFSDFLPDSLILFSYPPSSIFSIPF